MFSMQFFSFPGAVVEIRCPSSYENGYNQASYILHSETDNNGFLVEKLPVSEITDKSINLKQCKAFIKYSPSETCNVPACSASSGAHLSLLGAHPDKIFYTVGNLIYTPNTRYYMPPLLTIQFLLIIRSKRVLDQKRLSCLLFVSFIIRFRFFSQGVA